MKGNRKTQKSYFISVEGETEKWYFEHLEKLINACETRKQDVKFKIVIEKKIRFCFSTIFSNISNGLFSYIRF